MWDVKHVVLIHGNWSRGEQLADVRAAFEQLGFTAHTPTLRHHELPVDEGAPKIATLRVRDYVDDLVAFVEGLDGPPLLVGHSMGGLLAQLVAARTPHVGLVAACPAPAAGINASTPANRRMARPMFMRARPWARPIPPPSFERCREWIGNAQSEYTAREIYEGLVCESGRAQWEMLLSTVRLSKATVVDYAAITTPVLALGGEFDLIVPARAVRQTASRFWQGASVQVAGADHMVFSGAALPATMRHITKWMTRNHLLPNQ